MALGLAAALARPADGQGIPPPTPGVAPGELDRLAGRMVEEVRHLADDVAADLGPNPEGRHLIEDARELDRAVDEFRATARAGADPYAARRAYAGVDLSWHHLRGRLARPGLATPAVTRAVQRVDAVDARLHQALGANEPPPGYYEATAAPTGPPETRRLAHALVARAEALAATVRSTMGNDPNAAGLVADTSLLARSADVFHDALDANVRPDAAARAFGPVDEVADRIERYVTTVPVPPQVRSSWQAFASVEVLIHQNLGLPARQPAVEVAVVAPATGGPSPLVGLSDQLVATTGAIQQAFTAAAGQVTQGPEMAADAQRLNAAALDFRGGVAQGLPPNVLAFKFREVDACWQRMARRVNRVARGNIGPNVAMVLNLGNLCGQIHTALGLPGYPPTLNGPAFP